MANILVVEDESHIRFLIRKVLESAGHTVAEAANGLEALEILESSDVVFDLAILDIGMPLMNGIEFLAELQRRHYNLTVIVLTAHWNRIPMVSEYRISGHLFKPFSRQKMLDTIDSVIKSSVTQ